MPNLSEKEIVTPPARLSFPALFDPRPTVRGGTDLKYQATLLFPPDVDLAPFKRCLTAAIQERWDTMIKMPAKNNPIKPCEEKDLGGYEDGWHYVNAKSKYAPKVVDERLQNILDPDYIYAGCWVRAHLAAYAWEHPTGGKGVSFSLNGLQFVRDDDRFDGRRDVAEVFEPIDVGEEPSTYMSSNTDDIFE